MYGSYRLKYSLSLLYNWSYSLFYIISELWGSVGVSVLFWQVLLVPNNRNGLTLVLLVGA
jgi:ATP/ADP translocase